MNFRHSEHIWQQYPELTAGVISAEGVTAGVNVDAQVERYHTIARERLAGATESELPEIQAWRRTFSNMGLRPTQYRCASESLLRRFRKEGALPAIHPLIDLCNAVSLAFATPIAVFDIANVSVDLQVRHANGTERYLTFGGETEHPAEGEVIFADDAGVAHARRWTNRQSGQSAIRDDTASVLIVAEAMHDTAVDDMPRLVTTLADELSAIWSTAPKTAILTSASPVFAF